MKLRASAWLLCLTCGCSLVFDGEEYVFEDGGADADVGVDTSMADATPEDTSADVLPDIACVPGGTPGAACRRDGLPGACDAGDECCTGCLDPMGVCFEGSSTTACGTGGDACAACECEEDTCTDGACTPASNVQEALGAGSAHGCAIDTSGRLWCWGEQSAFSPGTGIAGPTAVMELTSVRTGSVGHEYTCALTNTSDVYCWGDGNTNLRFGITGDQSSPTTAVAGIAMATGVAAGVTHTCAINLTNELACWGSNAEFQLARDLMTSESALPLQVTSSSEDAFSQLAPGRYSTCALATMSNQIYCWGSNSSGQLGQGAVGPGRYALAAVSGGPWQTLCAGDVFACGLDTSGEVFCWGGNDDGQLGNATTTRSTTPTAITNEAGAAFVDIACGAAHACALADVGRLFCWGDNSADQLGPSATGDFSPTQVEVPETFTGVHIAGPMSNTTCATRDGALYCWGDNTNGQVGGSSMNDSISEITRVCIPQE